MRLMVPLAGGIAPLEQGTTSAGLGSVSGALAALASSSPAGQFLLGFFV